MDMPWLPPIFKQDTQQKRPQQITTPLEFHPALLVHPVLHPPLREVRKLRLHRRGLRQRRLPAGGAPGEGGGLGAAGGGGRRGAAQHGGADAQEAPWKPTAA